MEAKKNGFLEEVKLYCKIDYDLSPEDLVDYAKFRLAVKKQVKEEYEHRGMSADTMRYPLANGVLNIIHQLRTRRES